MTKMGLLARAMSIVLLLSALPANAQLTNYTQGFDDVPGIFATGGWVFDNLSNPPPGSTSPTGFWAQGIPGNGLDAFGDNAQSGPTNSFITVSFESGLGTGAAVSNWLLTPELTFSNGSVISFYTEQSPLNTVNPNRLQVRLSLSGASTNVGTQPTTVPGTQPSFGDFTSLLADINPNYLEAPAAGAYPTTWTQESFVISGLTVPTTGRIGFLYLLTNSTFPTPGQGSMIGIDTFSLTTVAEPSQMLLLALGGLGLFAFRLRVQRSN
jgi:hypothetical protein